MTIPQAPMPGPDHTPPSTPYGPGAHPAPPAQPDATIPVAPKKASPLTSKPVIGVAALVVGLILGSAAAGGGRAPGTGAAAAPAATVTATVTASSEPSAEPTTDPSDDPTEPAPTPADTSYKWGQKVGFTYEDVEITVKIDAPKASANMFDKDNLEAKLTVCNQGSAAIEEMSAEGIGLYAEDKKGGQYDLYGSYRSPEFPSRDWQSAKLKAGKCRTGWISFEDARKAVRIATEVDDTTYSWSKSGS